VSIWIWQGRAIYARDRKRGLQACIYSPTLSPPKPWENHPFSANATAVVGRGARSSMASGTEVRVVKRRQVLGADVEKNGGGMRPTSHSLGFERECGEEQPGCHIHYPQSDRLDEAFECSRQPPSPR
jgi:hypothetical protein